ncbi:ABC transporter permease subunit [Streptomyces sp. SBT349]|uniref:ABC transporter permease subunit n=1 Tax=Streptomyces sp. SBT349 TaxID=1580539 RepID=UPI00066D23B6|nr:ABC transporter permease subunit [Streptomyces sp. SBT349]
MNGVTPYRGTVNGRRPGFGRLLRAEWTKLRSVPRWTLALVGAVVVTVLIALLTASGAGRETSGEGGGGGEPPEWIGDGSFQDQGHFVYQPLAGDGEVLARVTEQAGSHAWAKAGVMIRSGDGTGASYAALMVTPDHGVRLQADFDTDIAGSGAGGEGDGGGVPRWLRLERAGAFLTGYESADGERWSEVGTVELPGLAADAEAGLFVASPERVEVERQFGGESLTGEGTVGEARFDGARVAAENGASGGADDGSAGGGWRDRERSLEGGGTSERGGDTFTLTGAGDIGRYAFADDHTRTALTGVLAGMMAIVAVAVLFLTTEFKRGLLRTTFAASPRRGRVLAAKATVIGGAAFAAGLTAALGALLLSRPLFDADGIRTPPLTDGPVLRAMVGTGLLLSAVAILSLGVAAIVRRSAAAIGIVLVLLLVPRIVATGLPLDAAAWLERLTPAAGFAVQQTVWRYDTAIGPWAGLGVLAAYAAAALALAHWRLRRRDA